MTPDTPMFRQYVELKAEHPDALLFFRMGDFYELFFEDAVVAAEALELTLTSRNKGAPDAVPMAGVPHHAARSYLATLLQKGFKVAIADQVEDPRFAKGLVKREVVRVVSPGVAWDADDLVPREPCWLAALAFDGVAGWGLAVFDVTTGDLRLCELDPSAQVAEELARLDVREVVLPERARSAPPPLPVGVPSSFLDDAAFDAEAAGRDLCRRLKVADLRGFGVEGRPPGLGCAGAVLAYAARNTRSELPQLRGLRTVHVSRFMVLDASTVRNLELLRPLHGTGRRGTLLGLLDRTTTAMGGRLLREWLAFPLRDLAGIRARHDAVQAFVQDGAVRQDVRDGLRTVADLERLAGKLAQQTASARDLVALRGSLEALPAVVARLHHLAPLARLVPTDLCPDVAHRVAAALVDEPPAAVTEGGLMRPGVSPELDDLVDIARTGKDRIAALEARERDATGIGSLKVRYNKVFGYYIEITQANLHRVPERYLRRQTLTSGERYITPELKELEEKVLGGEERRRALEYELFAALRAELAAHVHRLQGLAATLAELDVVACFADLAVDARYVRPDVHAGHELLLRAARHPVVERQALGEAFVPNDLRLGVPGRDLLIVTGPNMSGKSTAMRQAALIVLMAQVGSYVPADEARIGLCDRIFTRVGASDDLASGQSTFMVEMSETANILHHATDRSLVVLDEIGRGTSTYDGLAIAWAVAEDLHDRVRCRTLFATHYHELVELQRSRPGVANVSVAVSELGERIIFLRRLKEGGASRSYGIQCARLAGLPGGVVARARALLDRLERHAASHPGVQLELFQSAASPPVQAPPVQAPPVDPLREALLAVDPDAMTPREALQTLYRLRGLAQQ